jgi:hypothetical protein
LKNLLCTMRPRPGPYNVTPGFIQFNFSNLN